MEAGQQDSLVNVYQQTYFMDFVMKKILTLSCAAFVLTACATTTEDGQTDRNNTATGAIIGAVTGALIGGQLDDDGNRDRGILVGAAAGAAAGAGIGAVMDRQEDDFREALREEQRQSEIEIERVRDDLLKLTFDSEVTFDVNSSSIKPSFQQSLGKVANVISKYESGAEIVGHTDSTGSEAYNQRLSEQRAFSVQGYLSQQGTPSYQLSSRGLGETQPRATNETEAGRQLNRRVEIFVKPGNE